MPLSIAVIGAGVGGLSFSVLAHDHGHRVTLFERFVTPKPVGSGLVIQPVGQAVLDQMGASDAARALGQPITHMYGHCARTGREVLNVAYRGGQPGLALHRSALFHVLWERLLARKIALKTGVTIQSFADGFLTDKKGVRFGPFDLVVDCSGAGSALSPLRPRALSYGAIWGTVPWVDHPDLRMDQLRQKYLGARRMAGILPLGLIPGKSGPQAAVFWSMSGADLDLWPQKRIGDWKQEVAAIWPEMASILEPITATDQMTPARYAHGTLRRPYRNGIVFLGDGAHRASPQLGQGANMALLDSLALISALNRHADLTEALPAYAAMRRWHVRIYQAFSAVFTPMYQSQSHTLPLLRDRVLAPMATLPGVRHLLTALVSGDMIPPLAGEIFPPRNGALE